jgi:hypothetical protein
MPAGVSGLRRASAPPCGHGGVRQGRAGAGILGGKPLAPVGNARSRRRLRPPRFRGRESRPAGLSSRRDAGLQEYPALLMSCSETRRRGRQPDAPFGVLLTRMGAPHWPRGWTSGARPLLGRGTLRLRRVGLRLHPRDSADSRSVRSRTRGSIVGDWRAGMKRDRMTPAGKPGTPPEYGVLAPPKRPSISRRILTFPRGPSGACAP